jgi:CRP/FNR family transcriptional regulator, anaerobic regulatory protein
MFSPVSELPCLECPARTTTLCSGLDADDIHRLYELATETRHGPGAIVVSEESPADFVLNLRAGHALVSRLSEDGKRQILAFMFPGDFFGLTSEDNYHYSVTALSDIRMCRFERSRVEGLMLEYPQMERKFRFLLTRLLDSANELIFSLGRKTALQKVASFVWYISYRNRKLGQPGSRIQLPMHRADIADFMGITIETVSRSLTHLKKLGLIRLPQTDIIEILDPGALRQVGIVVAEPSPGVRNDPEHFPHKPSSAA